jgi:hypothetical protein
MVFGGWGTPNYQYQVFQAGGGQTPGPTNVLDGGTAASYTTIGLSAFVPPLSSLSVIRVLKATTVNPKVIWVRQNGASGDEYQLYTDGTRNEGEIIQLVESDG